MTVWVLYSLPHAICSDVVNGKSVASASHLNVRYLITNFFIFPFVNGHFVNAKHRVTKRYQFPCVDGEVMGVFHDFC